MKLSRTLKLTLGAIAAVGLISTAQASSFVISTDKTTLNVPIPPLTFTGSIQNNAGTSFNPVNLTAIIDTTPGHAMLDLLGSIHANGAGTIEVCLMADGFTGTSPLSFGFTANSVSTHGITLSDTLLINGMAQQASTNTVTLAPGFSQGVSNTVSITPNSSPFTLENCITITFGVGGGTVSFDKLLGQGVPDSGMTVSLLGIGLLAIAGVAKLRRMKVTA
jgi:hypothetical protein